MVPSHVVLIRSGEEGVDVAGFGAIARNDDGRSDRTVHQQKALDLSGNEKLVAN